ncbi:MAG: glycosyltransferase family A protein [Armatimonadota bacterium]|nr:glycosyltransferase family A protein [Armatimonadota bacterium]MDR7437338.1 glycosyltransferase family A protein [Armatimonadota bacterium]MDR7472677.1 glycosyltransferase family A protein [Armatimonadota bacterium]MDR7508059.1 glycosyltransferase family A protein [Armatimonadota bacterium]MDR7509034.1 glycosyltransferase family A protein [Armatimonadota bacterium]
MPDLTVVVPTYNQAELLRECLRSLVDQTLPTDRYEVIVVDDGSTDHTAAVLREFSPRVRAVRLPSNRGRSAARNAGIREAAAPLVVLIDSDIVVRPDFLDRHLDVHRRRGPGVVSRGPVVDVPDAATARRSRLRWVPPSPAFLTTANAAVEKAALLRAGLFDEDFPGYGWEDFELGLRLQRLGLRRVFCRQAVAFHLAPAARPVDVDALLAKEEDRARSAVHFYRKHPTFQTRILIQATRLHRLLYWLQTAGGLTTRENIRAVTSALRRHRLGGLADLALRGVLNRHYLYTLEGALKE